MAPPLDPSVLDHLPAQKWIEVADVRQMRYLEALGDGIWADSSGQTWTSEQVVEMATSVVVGSHWDV